MLIAKKVSRYLLSKIFASYQNASSISYYLNIFFGRSGVKVLQYDPINASKIAIFASFQNKPSVLLEKQICELLQAGFQCVFVSNAFVSKEFSTWLIDRVTVLISRPNIARDFGAYKCGYLYLYDNGLLNKCDELLFINDTIFFPLFETSFFWQQVNSASEDVIGAFESFSPRHHIQSFFMLCKNGVHLRPYFHSYWANYREWNSRLHAISYGEIGFTSMLKAGGARTLALINQAACVGLDLTDDINVSKGTLDTRNVLEKNTDLIWTTSPGMQRHIKLLLLFKQLEMSNPSHGLGLFAVLRLRLPLIKKDLVYRGTVTLGEIRLLNGEANVILPIDEILVSLKSKGLPAERSFWNKVKSWAGES